MTLGLKDLYYAVCTEADGAESYGAPKKMAEAMSADLSVKTADGSRRQLVCRRHIKRERHGVCKRNA